MNTKESALAIDALRSLLGYDPDSGVFVWLVDRGNGKSKVGDIAGYVDFHGYIKIEISGRAYTAHRLAWFLTHGVWPKYVDHVNGIRSDNRIENLRDVDFRTNIQNQRKASSNNKTGFLGVAMRKKVYAGKPYTAQIRDPNAKRMIHLGYFETAEEAHAAYVAKKREIHPGCTI